MSTFVLSEALDVLERTPRTLHAMLAGASQGWAAARERDDTWSPTDIVAHLIHGDETDWVARLRIILEHGESRPFAPFQREGGQESGKRRDLAALLGEFALVRARNLQTVRELNLTPELLRRRGVHPSLGPVTMTELLSTWTVHDLAHTAQIARAMACRYRDAVGPWNHPDYLRILQPR